VRDDLPALEAVCRAEQTAAARADADEAGDPDNADAQTQAEPEPLKLVNKHAYGHMPRRSVGAQSDEEVVADEHGRAMAIANDPPVGRVRHNGLP
jgi:hypothetical protein